MEADELTTVADGLQSDVQLGQTSSIIPGATAGHKKGWKVVKTIFLVLTWVCLGLYLEVTGPTLIDLKIRTHSNYEEVAFAVSGRSAGYFIGSAIGGVLVDKLGRFCDLMIALSLNGGAVATVIAPWSANSWVLWFLCVCQGTCEGVINIAGQKLIMELWLEKAASPLHILHGGFGIGSFIIPLIADPFLAVPYPKDMATNVSNVSGLSPVIPLSANDTIDFSLVDKTHVVSLEDNRTGTVEPAEELFLKESRIEYAYLIAAVITVALSTAFFVYHCTSRRKVSDRTKHREDDSRRWRDLINPASCAGGRMWYGIQIFALLVLHFVNCLGGERVLGKFIRAYAIDQLDFSKSDGSYLNTVFWISFSAGRVLGFLVARWVPIRILIVIEAVGVLVTTVLLNIFAHTHPLALWILTVPLGIFHAPLFPSGIGWGDFHIEMTGMGITTLLLGASLGGIAYLRLVGYLFDQYGPRSFLHVLAGYGTAAFVIAILLTLVGAQHGSRFRKKMPNGIAEEKTEKMAETEMLSITDRTQKC